jgi:nitrogen fixation protein FixH
MISDRPQGAFTGRHMLVIMVAFFGVVVVVNVTMAWFARASWTGFVVENSYVASQQFNAKMAETRAQAALGWTGRVDIEDGTVRYAISDATGDAVPLEAVAVTFRRPVDDREDHTVTLARDSRGYAATSEVADGAWIVQIDADAGLASHYRESLRIQVVGGSMQ